ncbi:TetR/AcrR family transcriptional regulator [Chryseosolibacter indicus]|uniref:TetR/AcrR family transcriptional regulator n=1 Tax=Chryseosolibacter indicus TaxID=2782351 RepID=A0ABS5VWB9_9BACT|nr:TetR/AcrR family transcriptional regulator [Chryseosolibacter indicus]MBT1705722.1 TetR/AcrR family transcriptional regulator [Chryseosolibacter indicus]
MEDSKVKIILEAAKKRFAHYGLAKTAMNEIANDIGMSKASLYYYFKDKDQIFIAVVEQDINEFVKVIEEVVERPSKASFKLKKYITLKNNLLIKLINLAKVETFNAADVFNPVYDELKFNFFTKEKVLIQKIFGQGIEQKEFNKFPVEQYAELFLTVTGGLRTIALATPGVAQTQERVNEQTALFLDIFLKSIRP